MRTELMANVVCVFFKNKKNRATAKSDANIYIKCEEQRKGKGGQPHRNQANFFSLSDSLVLIRTKALFTAAQQLLQLSNSEGLRNLRCQPESVGSHCVISTVYFGKWFSVCLSLCPLLPTSVLLPTSGQGFPIWGGVGIFVDLWTPF